MAASYTIETRGAGTLNREQWADVEDLFARAVELLAPERADFLARECADEEVRQEVKSLLDQSSVGLVAVSAAIQSAAASIATAPGDPLVGTWLGPYKIGGLLGRGGMGAVYRAVREDDQFRKCVAIKLIPRVLADPEAVARFRSERQILANLEHPNIARLLDGGTSEGIPYIVMEYVEGVPITEFVRAHNLDISGCLRLVQSVCAAVLYAHRHLVIHRDLKPGNILVTADGTVKLLDFGLAKLIDPTRSGPALITRLMMMTPDYASPEQILGAPVTTASDVYSLGVVLFEVLTGERPFKATSSNLQDLQQQIADTETCKPSSVETLPARTRRRLAGDIDNIVLMALHKNVSRRYGSAEQLSEDIRRHLQGLPVQARPDSVAYRAGKFIGRHRVAVMSAAGLALLLVCGVIAVLWEGRQADLQRRRAEQRVGQLVELANRTLFDVHAAIERLPGATQARKKIVATTLDYLDQLARETGDDARVQLALASAYARLAEVRGDPNVPSLGEWTGALATYQKAARILDALLAREPRHPVYLLRRAQVSVGLTTSLIMFEKRKEAQPEVVRGIGSAEAFLAIQPGNLEGRKLEAELQRDRLTLLLEQDPAAAERDALRLLPKYSSLASQYPNDPEAITELAGAQIILGAAASLQNRRAEALGYFQQVAQLLEPANRLHPHDVVIQKDLLRTYSRIAANLDASHASPEELRQYTQKEERMAASLRAADPSDFMVRFDVAQAYYSLGTMTVPLAQVPESLRMLGEAQKIIGLMIADSPTVLRLKVGLIVIYSTQGEQLERLHRYREALSAYRALLDVAGGVAAVGPGTYADNEQAVGAAQACKLLAILGERRESLAFAAKAAAAGDRIQQKWPGSVATLLKQVGDAMVTLARKPGPAAHRSADLEAARNYYSQAQKIWASLPEGKHKDYQKEITETSAALAACQRELTRASVR